jgi:A/G-specific adenine glycosylase
MDYGTHLKQTVGNLSRRSAVYTRQSQFAGSFRQVRGQVIRALQAKPKAEEQLRAEINDERLASAIEALIEEGLVRRQHNKLSL